MKVSCKTLLCSFCVVYVCLTVLAVYNLYCHEGNACFQKEIHSSSYSEVSNKDKMKGPSLQTETLNEESGGRMKYFSAYHQVEIWGKAAIGLYLWSHIINGRLEKVQGGLVQHGNLTIDNIVFTFRTGPGIIPSTVPNDVKHLVLVLNGRSQEKIDAATLWLNYLPTYKYLQKLAVVLLGNEECNNDWILTYMKSRGGRIDVVFVVYDSRLVDNVEFFQWPLGVAVYRGFPVINPQHVDVTSARSYLCNFLGTIYVNSSRLTLLDIVKASAYHDKCIINGRKVWPPAETTESLNTYMKSLLNSDLTLSPVGKNSECYRIYEAMSLGSVPVVEDVITPGNCDASSTSPLRLLKYYNAPLIYVKDWHDLPQILLREARLTREEKVKRRIAVIEWYSKFKRDLRSTFLNVIQKTFFNK
ncbi:ribitol-5-phosphate xylosyltransferase 1 isoform X2 [Anabrus simplex]|uniref:ribitol-5-phosphate xylosyltransferase 1 isoform X2 n=1 Tax=Anabrus simplex TaxID=316456 RepID=UPI0035A262FD